MKTLISVVLISLLVDACAPTYQFDAACDLLDKCAQHYAAPVPQTLHACNKRTMTMTASGVKTVYIPAPCKHHKHHRPAP